LEGLVKENLGTFNDHLVYVTATGNIYGHLVYFMVIGYILLSFGIFYGHLVYFMVIWYIFPRFGILFEEKSGSTAAKIRQVVN
jgi:hypothetical protein